METTLGNIILRSKTWYLKRRVPKRFAAVDARSVIWESLKTDSLAVAKQKAEQVWRAYIEGWEARLAGRDGDAEARFRAAGNLADMRSFQFLMIDEVAKRPVEEIVARVEAIANVSDAPDTFEASALLGSVEEPTLLLSQLVSHVEKLAKYENRFKSEQQMRLWRSPRKRAVANLITAIGSDRPVVSITSADARTFRKHWQKRILDEAKSVDTANKDFSNLAGMLSRFYEDIDHPDTPRPFSGINIRDKHTKKVRKKEVPLDWIIDKWFAPGAFDGLNAEARDILLICIETGCRQSEIHDLPASAFHLDAGVPHIFVQNEIDPDSSERREIKNVHSTRAVPLIGVALAAARRHPTGFPRYRNKRGFSAVVNKYLRNKGLLPEGVTAGGLRHTWESRLKAVGLQTDDRGELMGHSVAARRGREVYGDDLSLPDRHALIAPIALTVPAHLA